MPPKGHVILSASSSDRWLHCPPSASLCETYEDKGSNYTAEGTDAHSLCEYKLRKALGMEATDPTENLDWYNAETEDCSTGYARFIMELLEEAKQTCSDPVVLIEQRVDFSRWVEQGFETSDAILISDGTMHVIDYKHGLGILVSAENNPQMKCYALGDSFYPAIIDKDTYQKAQEERKCRATKLGRNNKQTQMREIQISTHFYMKDGVALHDNPVRQAEYLYSLIESESQ